MSPQRTAPFAALILAGCISHHIEVTVRPQGDGTIDRGLRIWTEHGSDVEDPEKPSGPPLELLVAPRELYGTGGERTRPMEVSFRKVFDAVPQDLADGEATNQGTYTVRACQLGTVHHYRERLPGRSDFDAQFLGGRELADDVARLFVAMARNELAGEQGLDALVEKFEGPVRQDLRDFAALIKTWSLGRGFHAQDGPDEDAAGFLFLAFELAVERGYLEQGDLEALRRNERAGVERANAWLARAMGREGEPALASKLAFLEDDRGLKEAWNRAERSLGLSEDAFGDRLWSFLGGGTPNGAPTHVTLRLVLSVAPYATNGRWVEDAAQVQWGVGWQLDARWSFPPFAYAEWAVPDEAWQKARFGRVALAGRGIETYARWEEGLAPEERERWRVGMDRLDPTRDLRLQILAIARVDRVDSLPAGPHALAAALELSDPGDERGKD